MASDLYARIHACALNFITSYQQEIAQHDISMLSSTLSNPFDIKTETAFSGREHSEIKAEFSPTSFQTPIPGSSSGDTNPCHEQRLLATTTEVWTSWTIEPKDIIVDERTRKAVVITVHHMKKASGREYPFEVVYTLYTSEDGGTVDKIVHWVDTTLASQLMNEQEQRSGGGGDEDLLKTRQEDLNQVSMMLMNPVGREPGQCVASATPLVSHETLYFLPSQKLRSGLIKHLLYTELSDIATAELTIGIMCADAEIDCLVHLT
ncbi:hypothetical protein LTR86_004329 [Recurvomyces mirabilis]|nr:hypothetical protein LTR86_004329 [Recurvomyces mirabilis]